MSGWYIASLVTGIVGILICSVSYAVPSRKMTLFFRLMFDFVMVINCFCVYFATENLLIFASCANSFIGMFRDIVFYFRGEKKWASSYLWLVGFELFYISSAFITWGGPIGLLPLIGGMINTFALYLKDSRYLKATTLLGQVFFITYYVLLISGTDMLQY